MEERINIGGKVWIVPANKVPSLVAWLQANAVDGSRPVPMQESMSQGKELLTENG